MLCLTRRDDWDSSLVLWDPISALFDSNKGNLSQEISNIYDICLVVTYQTNKMLSITELKSTGTSRTDLCMLGCRQQLLAHNSQWLRRAQERAAKIMWLFAQAVICTGRWIEAYLRPPKVLWRGVWCPSLIGSRCCILVWSASGVRTLISCCTWRKPVHLALMKCWSPNIQNMAWLKSLGRSYSCFDKVNLNYCHSFP